MWSIISLFNMKCNECDFAVVWPKYTEEKRFSGTIKLCIYSPHFVVFYLTQKQLRIRMRRDLKQQGSLEFPFHLLVSLRINEVKKQMYK